MILQDKLLCFVSGNEYGENVIVHYMELGDSADT